MTIRGIIGSAPAPTPLQMILGVTLPALRVEGGPEHDAKLVVSKGLSAGLTRDHPQRKCAFDWI